MSQFAYDDAMLVNIISGTGAALDKMGSVNNQVMGIAGQLPTVNNSTSGIRLAAALGDWNSSFSRVVNDLRTLNDKANQLLQVNRTANADADAAAGGAAG
ncbi:hypothetical protein [Saccharothrix yanglingensis]|uniref:Uncharacterized protein n=1 Tax=Saccharothrix yanglingensis TaxID=659496 RepID=A0ABU0XAS1_9PSEU|nr:hypothetical protein [Saccharothrix yanglingensis]MDQ2589056.1 hypothetical protein [Saccharothrix yanglingensis]